MWWTCVVAERHQSPETGIKLGGFDGAVIGDKKAKKAAKRTGREYIKRGGPGQLKLVESSLKLDGSVDMTWTELEGAAALEALDSLNRSNEIAASKKKPETHAGLISSSSHADGEHIDAACAWLNVEYSVFVEVAQRDYGIHEVEVVAATQEPIRRSLVDALGEQGNQIFEEFAGGDLPDEFAGGDLPDEVNHAELAAKLNERFAEASLELAFYLLASKWSIQGLLREAGATEEIFESVWSEAYSRLIQLFGEETTERAARLTYEFNTFATG